MKKILFLSSVLFLSGCAVETPVITTPSIPIEIVVPNNRNNQPIYRPEPVYEEHKHYNEKQYKKQLKRERKAYKKYQKQRKKCYQKGWIWC